MCFMQMIMKEVKIMKFYEANEIVKSFDEDPELEYWMPNSKVYEIIEGLRKEYAPMVEMTEMQMKQMMSFKEVNAGFSTFMYKQGLGQLPSFSDFITTQRENELMQAWLYPKTIKVVDE